MAKAKGIKRSRKECDCGNPKEMVAKTCDACTELGRYSPNGRMWGNPTTQRNDMLDKAIEGSVEVHG